MAEQSIESKIAKDLAHKGPGLPATPEEDDAPMSQPSVDESLVSEGGAQAEPETDKTLDTIQRRRAAAAYARSRAIMARGEAHAPFQFDELAIEVPALSEPLQESVVLGLRPENVLISSEPVAGGTWETKIERIDELGDSRLMHLPLGSSGLIARSENRDLNVGMSLFVRPDWERVHWFAPSSGKRL